MSRSSAILRFLSPIIIKIHDTKPLSIANPGNTRRNIPERSLIVLVASLAGLAAFPQFAPQKQGIQSLTSTKQSFLVLMPLS